VCCGNAGDRWRGEGWIFLPVSLSCAGSLFPLLFPRRFVRFFSFLTHAFSFFFPAASKLATAPTFNVTDVEFWFGAAGDIAVASKSVACGCEQICRRCMFLVKVYDKGLVNSAVLLCVCDVSWPPGFQFVFMW
jgi:hypothetical protein